MKAPKIEVIDRYLFLLLCCVCAATVMVAFFDKNFKYSFIALIVLGVTVVLAFIYTYLRMLANLGTLKSIKPAELLARLYKSLCGLKAIDTNTLAWVIGILALCLVVIGFVFYVGVQSAAGVVPLTIVTGVFIVIGIVFVASYQEEH